MNIREEACLLFEVGSSSLWPFRCFVLCMHHIVNSRYKMATRKEMFVYGSGFEN